MRTAIHPINLRDASYVMQNLRAEDRAEAACQAERWDPVGFAERVVQIPYAWSILLDGNPEAVFGAQHFSSTTVIAWAVGTDKMQRTIPAMQRFILGPLRDQLIRDGYRWAEARSYVEHQAAHNWLVGLGFEGDTYLDDYGNNGEDFILFRSSLLG